jgi:hypothetical protein
VRIYRFALVEDELATELLDVAGVGDDGFATHSEDGL